jgi:hypothetical protein
VHLASMLYGPAALGSLRVPEPPKSVDAIAPCRRRSVRAREGQGGQTDSSGSRRSGRVLPLRRGSGSRSGPRRTLQLMVAASIHSCRSSLPRWRQSGEPAVLGREASSMRQDPPPECQPPSPPADRWARTRRRRTERGSSASPAKRVLRQLQSRLLSLSRSFTSLHGSRRKPARGCEVRGRRKERSCAGAATREPVVALRWFRCRRPIGTSPDPRSENSCGGPSYAGCLGGQSSELLLG